MGDLARDRYLGQPRRFELHRYEDFSVLGTGVVAWGVLFPNGRVVTVWNSIVSQTCVWMDMKEVEAVHGHAGATRIVWIDT